MCKWIHRFQKRRRYTYSNLKNGDDTFVYLPSKFFNGKTRQRLSQCDTYSIRHIILFKKKQ